MERGRFLGLCTSGALLGLVTQVPSIWREEALRIVWEIGGRAVLPGLIEELRDQTVAGRRAVLGVLAETRDPSVFELADRTLSSDPSASMREAALRLLARGGPDLRRGTLERAMLDPQGSVRAQAISLLTRDGGTEGERALLAALEDPNDDVSAAAVGPLADLVADRDLSRSGVNVEFFGATARMPAGPALLAATTGATLLPVGLWFTGDGGWGQHIGPPVDLLEQHRMRERVATGTQTLANAFAAHIAAHPSDWHMLQRLWLADLDASGLRGDAPEAALVTGADSTHATGG
jgi:hypothetical protein